MDLCIAPYAGVGPLRFGARPQDTRAFLGEPRASRAQPGKLRELHEGGIACTYEGGRDQLRLVEIGFGKTAGDLEYEGMRLFEVPRTEALQRLLADDPEAAEVLGSLVFLRLGLTMTGFHDRREESLAVTAFTRGRWDAHIPNMKRFRP
jgi:hypothetical protein